MFKSLGLLAVLLVLASGLCADAVVVEVLVDIGLWTGWEVNTGCNGAGCSNDNDAC